VLAGNSVTSITVLSCLNTADARHLRRLHPAVAGAVAAVPWCDTVTPVVDVVRWRAGLPGAVGARLTRRAMEWKLGRLTSEPVWAALGGVTHLNLCGCAGLTDKRLLRLPSSLRVLDVSYCGRLSMCASFAHLTALTSLDCCETHVVTAGTAALPPSLQELDVSPSIVKRFPTSMSLVHMSQLRVLRIDGNGLDTNALASLPPSLEELHAFGCWWLNPAPSFAHLTALRKLEVIASAIDDASLASMPPCLVDPIARDSDKLTPAAALPHLPALRLLDASDTGIGDALVGSLPASLVELRLAGCRGVTAGASLDHLRALRVLHCIGTALAPAALAACRARGCVVPAARQLRGHPKAINSLALLGDGRLASGDAGGEVRLWDVAAEDEAAAVLTAGFEANALAVLRDGRHLATGPYYSGAAGCIAVWDVGGVPPVRRTTIDCRWGVWALAALANGRLAAGCADGAVRVVDVDARAARTTLTGLGGIVTALVVLPDGALVSGSPDSTVRVWDVGVRACVATLVGHTREVHSLAGAWRQATGDRRPRRLMRHCGTHAAATWCCL